MKQELDEYSAMLDCLYQSEKLLYEERVAVLHKEFNIVLLGVEEREADEKESAVPEFLPSTDSNPVSLSFRQGIAHIVKSHLARRESGCTY